MGALMSHVEHLSETIGPRPATTDAEEQAASYIREAFEARGLTAEVQEFDSPRTYSWAYVIYHALTILAAVASNWSAWPALALGVAVAILFRLDLDTRWGLTSLMPKGPSQNVIARHIPRAGRGERVAKVVIVAHYDSARASLAFAPGMVKNFAATFGLMKWCTYLVPVLIAARLLPYASRLEPWAWYVTLVPAAYLLVPLLIDVHREIFMKYTPGANDNASGVAALLGLVDRLVPESETAQPLTRDAVTSHTEQEVQEAEVVPEGSLLSYSPVAAPASEPALDTWADDDISWDTGVVAGQTELGLDSYARAFKEKEEAGSSAADSDAQTAARLFGAVPPASAAPAAPVAPAAPAAPAPAPRREAAPDLGFDIELDDGPSRASDSPGGEETAPFTPIGLAETPEQREERHRGGLFGSARKDKSSDRRGVREWLGVGKDFDARKQGDNIGSWDNFTDNENDETTWKGGAAGVEGIDDPDFASSVAARIRRRVTMNVDRGLTEKEVWFVATGAEEVGTFGMQAFLKRYGPDLREAAIINLDNIGTGSLTFVTREGMAKHYDSDRRLVSAARRAVREADLPLKGHEYKGLSTDATPALARGYHAMSVMAFDVNGRLPNWHWATDTADNVSESNLDTAVEFVTALIKEL
jgi:hypothetical protein